MAMVRSESDERGSGVGAEAVSLTVEELMDLLNRNEDIFVVDVRNEEEFDSWRLEGRDGPVPAVNKPYFELLEEGGRDNMVESVMAYAARQLGRHLAPGSPHRCRVRQGGHLGVRGRRLAPPRLPGGES